MLARAGNSADTGATADGGAGGGHAKFEAPLKRWLQSTAAQLELKVTPAAAAFCVSATFEPSAREFRFYGAAYGGKPLQSAFSAFGRLLQNQL